MTLCRLKEVTKISADTMCCVLWFTIHPLVTSMFHYNGAVNGGSSPQFTSSHPNTLWQLLPRLDMGMLISCNILQTLCECYLVNQSESHMSTESVHVTVSIQCSTLYAEWLRRHGRNEESLCALVLHLWRLLRGSATRCRWAQWRGGWEAVLGGERRSCLANCRV